MSMTQSTSGAPGAWRVTGVSPATRRAPTGQFVDGMVVHFVTGSGAVSTVFVPDNAFSQATVARAVATKAAVIDSVAQLSSEG